jgi:hypothetical protein
MNFANGPLTCIIAFISSLSVSIIIKLVLRSLMKTIPGSDIGQETGYLE